ncbi:MAG: long-chain fatty acid--CoA ligase [Alphaproteobacteria bacterium]|nr:long-chain fatty acid--CoA ligase [Alphaproteobacteria bacterium]
MPDYPWLKSYSNKVDWYADTTGRPVYAMLAETARRFGDRPALDFLGRKWTWGEIESLSARMAKGLQEKLGVRKGDRIGLFLPNTPYYIVAYFAVARVGAIAVNMNPLYAERELGNLIEDSGCRIIVTVDLKLTWDKMHAMLHASALQKLVLCRFADALPFPKNLLFRVVKASEIGKPRHEDRFVWFDDLLKNDGKSYEVPIDPLKDVALLQYTGGTTGVPKGAMLTHANVTANAEQCHLWFPDSRDGEEKMVAVLPFFHVFAMTGIMNMSVRKGLEIVALPRFDLKATLALIDRYKPHYFLGVPAIFNAIVNFPGRDRYDLSSLRFCVSGGAPLPIEVKKSFEDITGCSVVEGYGLSEASPVVCVNPAYGKNKPGSIGLPLPGTIVEIVDMKTGEKQGPGHRGELCVRGPQVMAGYWNREKETAATLKEGCLHTGDVAMFDEEGYFFIVDRIKDMIITNGYNVYPRNVEEAIYLHPSVEECVVGGLPDKRRGEIVKAWIKCKDDRCMTETDLREFLKDKLSPMEIPKQIEFRREPLPKTMIGKLSRKDLIEEEMRKKG